MSLATMRNNILRFCPLHPDVISSTIQDSYRQLGMLEWNRLNVTRTIHTFAPYSTGTVTITSAGVVTGIAATFTAAMVGREMRVGLYQDSFFEIAMVTPPSTLTLLDWTGATISVACAFTIFPLIYSVNVSMKVIFEVAYQTSLTKKSQDFFNRRDPQRSSTGSPTWWAYAGYNVGGYSLIEVYPVADQVYPLRVYGKVNTSVLGDSDTPLLSEDLIENHALLACYRIKNAMEPKAGWNTRMADQQTTYDAVFAAAQDEDYVMEMHRERVKDYMDNVDQYPASDTFWASHDIE